MHTGRRRHLLRTICHALLLAASGYYIVSFLTLAGIRMIYPYELEWMEGSVADHVMRLLDGHSLYVKPTISFVPAIYTPLYFYISAAVTWITGIGFTPLRLVSILSTVGVLVLLFQLVRKETGQWVLGTVAAGLYAAAFRIAGAWYDLAREDSLYLFLALAALYVVRFSASNRSMVFAALLGMLAFMTKQTALPFVAPITVYLLLTNWKRGVLFGLVLLGSVGVAFLILNTMSQGWFYYYTIYLPSTHTLAREQFTAFWTQDILSHFWIEVMLAMALLWITFRQKARRQMSFFYLFAGIGMLTAAWLGRLKTGGYDDALMPACAFLAMSSAIGAAALIEKLRTVKSLGKGLAWGAICLPILLQLLLVRYPLAAQLPSDRDRAEGDRLIELIKSFPGPVLIPYHNFYTVLAGKPIYAHKMAIGDVLRAEDSVAVALQANVDSALATGEFDAVIEDAAWFQESVSRTYDCRRGNFGLPNVFIPVAGYRTKPRYLCVPRAPLSQAGPARHEGLT